MANTIVDLWPPDLEAINVIPPIAFLKGQATALGNRTKNLLEGRVVTQISPRGGEMQHVFEIVAPVLGGYSYPLLVVTHNFDLYPLTVKAFVDEGDTGDHSTGRHCDTEDEFLNALHEVFSDQRTMKVVGALLAQSQA